MRIGFLGNTNNFPFILARALRRLGADVVFVVSRPEPLNRPEHRYGDITSPYPAWIRDIGTLNPFDYVLPTQTRRRVIRLLSTCDGLILNELGPTLLKHLKQPAIVLLTGSDLEYYGDVRTAWVVLDGPYRGKGHVRRFLAANGFRALISAQRRGIRSAVAVNYFHRGVTPRGDALLDEIGVPESRRMSFLLADVDQILPEPPPKNSRIRIFNTARLNWKAPMPPDLCRLDYKGSDIMIRGLGLFCRRKRFSMEIRLVKKGLHVAETMQLVEAEGLSNYVTWLEEITQRQVWDEFRHADIVFDQLGMAVVSMGGLEAMAMGRPLIANGRPEIFEPLTGPSPICQARTPEEVCAQLERLVPDAEERERVGVLSRRYVEESFSPERAARLCLERLSGLVFA